MRSSRGHHQAVSTAVSSTRRSSSGPQGAGGLLLLYSGFVTSLRKPLSHTNRTLDEPNLFCLAFLCLFCLMNKSAFLRTRLLLKHPTERLVKTSRPELDRTCSEESHLCLLAPSGTVQLLFYCYLALSSSCRGRASLKDRK